MISPSGGHLRIVYSTSSDAEFWLLQLSDWLVDFGMIGSVASASCQLFDCWARETRRVKMRLRDHLLYAPRQRDRAIPHFTLHHYFSRRTIQGVSQTSSLASYPDFRAMFTCAPDTSSTEPYVREVDQISPDKWKIQEHVICARNSPRVVWLAVFPSVASRVYMDARKRFSQAQYYH